MTNQTALIIQLNQNNLRCQGIVLDYDGQPEEAGKTLRSHYNTDKQLNHLIEYANINETSLSMLGETVNQCVWRPRTAEEDRWVDFSKRSLSYKHFDFVYYFDVYGHNPHSRCWYTVHRHI